MATTENEVSQRATEYYKRAFTVPVNAPIEKIQDLYSGWADTYDKVFIG